MPKAPKSKKALWFELISLLLLIIVLGFALTKMPELWGFAPIIPLPW